MQLSVNARKSGEYRSDNRANESYAWAVLSVFAFLVSFAPVFSHSQETAWPSKTVTVIVGFGAGGVTDLMARTASMKLSEDLKQTFVVENRVGAAGAIAAAYVARSVPDGYTLFFAASPQIAVIPQIQKVNYDPIADFAPVSSFFGGPFILVIRPSIPAKSIPEFVSFARTHKVTYGSSGSGSLSHLLGALFLSRAGIEGTHVPFRGGHDALTALLGGQIDMYFSPGGNIMPYTGGSDVTILGIAGERRLTQLPTVPTINEFYPNVGLPDWGGFLVSARTPKTIIDKLSRHVIAAARDPANVAAMAKLGLVPGGETPEEFAAQIKRDQPLFDAAIHAANLKPQ